MKSVSDALLILQNDRKFKGASDLIKITVIKVITQHHKFMLDNENNVYVERDGHKSHQIQQNLPKYLADKGCHILDFGRLFLVAGSSLNFCSGEIIRGDLCDKIRGALRRNGESINQYDIGDIASELIYRWKNESKQQAV
jgi:hypothetical protein